MLYANHPARCFTGHPDRPFQGQKCYQYMMGLEEQCPFCPMRELGGRDSYTTQDQVLTMTGTSSNVEPLKTLLQVDALVESVASFIPDNAMRQQFLQRFRRKPLQQAYRNGKSELQQELLSYYDDKSIRWTRMTARLIANPNTGDLEAILYGMDISREKNYKARIASAQQEKSALLELAQQDPLTGLYSKTAFAEKTQAFLDSTPAAAQMRQLVSQLSLRKLTARYRAVTQHQ